MRPSVFCGIVAHACPAVVVLGWISVALELAVTQKWLHGVAPAVPVQVKPISA